MGVVGSELRSITIGTYTINFACLYIDDITTPIPMADFINYVKAVGGMCNGYCAMSTAYVGYSALNTIDVTDGNKRLTQTIRSGGIFVAAPSISISGLTNLICPTGGSWGYDGGNPWVEFSPMVCCVHKSTGMVLKQNGGFSYINNTQQSINVTANNNMFQLSLNIYDPAFSAGFWSFSGESEYNIKDLSKKARPSTDDPFGPGGVSGPGGGSGPFTGNGEDITDPELPDIDAVSTGFITLFNPSISQLNSLASYMWSGGFDVNTFKKLFANPMDCILGLSILPKIVPNGGSATVMVGNISTNISMTKAARQYIKYDCGSINISRYSNSFLDYEPYTKIYLYLPFIGIHQISTDDVMNKSLQVKYTVDILSGACVAFVIAGGTTLYSYIGQCAASVPITAQDWSTMINGVLGAVGSVASAIGSLATGNIAGAIGGAASTAQNVIGSKPDVQHSGSMGGMGGMLGIKTPYVIIERPAQAIPENQNSFTGYPAFTTMELEDLKGYNEIFSIHLENVPATETELKEIESLLKSGVIF